MVSQSICNRIICTGTCVSFEYEMEMKTHRNEPVSARAFTGSDVRV